MTSATQTDGLLTALLAVQQEAPTLPKDATNPHYRSKYTPLDTIVEQIGPILSKHGLVWTAMPCRDDSGEPALHYRLAHVHSGDVLEGTMPLLLTKQDSQGMGSALTYARRYSLCAVLNLVADDDDDGQAASGAAAEQPRRAPSDAQLGFLERLLKDAKVDNRETLLAYAREELTSQFVSALIDRLKDADEKQQTLVGFAEAAEEWESKQPDIPADTDGLEIK